MPTAILSNKKGMAKYLEMKGHRETELPAIAGTYKGRDLVICGDAACVWDDLARFGCANRALRGKVWKSGWQFMTVNKMVETFPGDIEHCYSNSPSWLLQWMKGRRTEYAREFSAPANSHSIMEGAKWTWPFAGHGTSGLGACLIAIGLGYARVVLAGMPLDNSNHNGEPPWRKCAFEDGEAAGSAIDGWESHWKEAWQVCFQNKVRSLSGRTRGWLGDAIEWG